MDSHRLRYDDDVIAEAEDELIQAVRNYSDAINGVIEKNGNVPTINQMEDIWVKLNDETRNIFVKMVSGTVSAFNENELISSKKANTSRKG